MKVKVTKKTCPTHGIACSGNLCGLVEGLVEGRDPRRIDVMLGLLRAYWVKYPGLRLGQIIVNLTSNDPYNVEDTVLEQALRAALNKGKGPNGERPRKDRT